MGTACHCRIPYAITDELVEQKMKPARAKVAQLSNPAREMVVQDVARGRNRSNTDTVALVA